MAWPVPSKPPSQLLAQGQFFPSPPHPSLRTVPFRGELDDNREPLLLGTGHNLLPLLLAIHMLDPDKEGCLPLPRVTQDGGGGRDRGSPMTALTAAVDGFPLLLLLVLALDATHLLVPVGQWLEEHEKEREEGLDGDADGTYTNIHD